MAKNKKFINILTTHSKHFLTYSNRNKINSALADELQQKIKSTFVCEKYKNVLDLGRGNELVANGPFAPYYRYIHPVLAMQSFNNLHHIEKHWEGSLKKFYPNDVDHQAVLECAKLCAHFFGEFASDTKTKETLKPIFPFDDDGLLELLADQINTQHESIKSSLQGGVKTVGTPGIGKTTILSTTLLASVLNNTDTTVCLSHGDEFGFLSLDFSNTNKFAATIKVLQNPRYRTDSSVYIESLQSELDQLIPPSKPQCLIIDPLEQENNSSALLSGAENMYEHLFRTKPHLVTFAAHPTPRITIPNQGKSYYQGDIFPGLQFINMELSQESMQELFFLVSRTSNPLISDDEMKQYLEFASKFTVPTFRSWISFLQADHSDLLFALEATFPNLGRYDILTKADFRDLSTFKHLGSVDFIPNSFHHAFNTDDCVSSAVRSQFSFMNLRDKKEVKQELLEQFPQWTNGLFFNNESALEKHTQLKPPKV